MLFTENSVAEEKKDNGFVSCEDRKEGSSGVFQSSVGRSFITSWSLDSRETGLMLVFVCFSTI